MCSRNQYQFHTSDKALKFKNLQAHNLFFNPPCFPIPDVDDGQAQHYQMISECSHHNIVLTPIRFMRVNIEIGVGKS